MLNKNKVLFKKKRVNSKRLQFIKKYDLLMKKDIKNINKYIKKGDDIRKEINNMDHKLFISLKTFFNFIKAGMNLINKEPNKIEKSMKAIEKICELDKNVDILHEKHEFIEKDEIENVNSNVATGFFKEKKFECDIQVKPLYQHLSYYPAFTRFLDKEVLRAICKDVEKYWLNKIQTTSILIIYLEVENENESLINARVFMKNVDFKQYYIHSLSSFETLLESIYTSFNKLDEEYQGLVINKVTFKFILLNNS